MAVLIPIIIFLLIKLVMKGLTALGREIEKEENEERLQFEKSLREAEQGDIGSQYDVALNYLKGKGITKDETKAVYWFEQSAEQGSIEGQFSSARLYAKGRGIQKSDTKAAYWYEKAAQQGKMEAQFRLAHIYLEGRGVEQSDMKAFEWIESAAKNNHGQAQAELGTFYLEGKVTDKDLLEASKWFYKAAHKDIAEAQLYLGLMYIEGIGIEVDEAKATEWLMKAAKQKHMEAQYFIGICYIKGIGVEQNIYSAVSWLSKASNQGHNRSQAELGNMYLAGEGVIQNNSKAFNFLLKAAKQGISEAQLQVGKMYYEGVGVEKDIYEADKWLDRSNNEMSLHIESQLSLSSEFLNKDKKESQSANEKVAQSNSKILDEDKLLLIKEDNSKIQINKEPTLNTSNILYPDQANRLLKHTLNKPSLLTISIACRFDSKDMTFKTLGYSASFGNSMIQEEIDSSLKNISIIPNDERYEYWFDDGINLLDFCSNEEHLNFYQFDRSKWQSDKGKAIVNITILDEFIYDIEKTDIPLIMFGFGINMVLKWILLTMQINEVEPKSSYFKNLLVN